MAASTARRAILEVERKFARLKVYPLHQNAGSPPFRQLEHLGNSHFRDIYYDQEDKLSKAGLWVRRRDGEWQMKLRQSGDRIRSAMKESNEVEHIADQVHAVIGIRESAQKAFGLAKLADITTHRELWKADGRFTIVLDQTDFGHIVGEVELEEPKPLLSSQTVDVLRDMENDINEFMDRYSWVFDQGPAKGKLTAYFEQKSLFEEAKPQTRIESSDRIKRHMLVIFYLYWWALFTDQHPLYLLLLILILYRVN